MSRKNGFYNFDVNMTEACTLRCTYCIENFNKPHFESLSDENLEKIFEKIDFLINDFEFLQYYDGVNISFWGGEPTLNKSSMEKFLRRYKDNDKVAFFVYSNGYKIDHMFDLYEEFAKLNENNINEKFKVQMSYDGLYSHDADRVNLAGKGSAKQVRKNILELAKRKINFHTHSTLAFKNFDKISQNYYDYKELEKEIQEFLPNYSGIYSPTIDYLSDFTYSNAEMKEFCKIITNEFKKIKDDEIDFFNKNGMFFMGWLNPNRAICSAGKNMGSIDLDGSVYPCHGVMNSGVKNKLHVNNIFLKPNDFKENLLKSFKIFEKVLDQKLPDACNSCKTHYCLKCNSRKYELSNKETLAERWVDYPVQDNQCYLFKHFGNLREAFIFSILKKYPNCQFLKNSNV